MTGLPFARRLGLGMNKAAMLSIFLLLLGSGGLRGQNRALKQGDKRYEQMMYPAAIERYTRGLSKEQDLRAMERLADCFEQVGDYQQAEHWYSLVVNMKGVNPNSLLRYAQVLRANGREAEAKPWLEAYQQTGVNPARAARLLEASSFAQKARQDSSRFQVTPEPLNTGSSEFSPIIHLQGYIFVGEAKWGGRKLVNARNNNAFYDLYYAQRSPRSKKGMEISRLKGKVNSKFHDGPASLTRDQSTLYFTRSCYVADRQGKNPSQHSKLKLFSAKMSRGKWVDVTPLPFNSDNYSCGHPAVSLDGNALVFASDIPGGFGGTDLYVCFKEGDVWGTPQNLGSQINTEGEEQFPYLHPSGALFYSSDGKPGFGGFDIFYADKVGEKWGDAVNAGYGMNSTRDDFGIVWNGNRSAGYFSSDRKGSDDIFQFKRTMRFQGTIVDRETGKPVGGAAVTIADASGKETKYTTESDGRFVHNVDWGKEYLVTASKADFLQLRERINTGEVGPVKDLDKTLYLEHDLVLSLGGQITDASTGQALPGATVRIISNKESSVNTDNQGSYRAQLQPNQEYNLVVSKRGYVPQILRVSTEGKVRSEDFNVAAALQPGRAVLIDGKTVVMETQAALAGVRVLGLVGEDQQESSSVVSRSDGRFWQVLMPGKDVWLIASKEGYFASRADVPGIEGNIGDTTISLTVGMVPFAVGALVKTIYYEYNKSDIRRQYSKDLMEIVYFLQDNPSASVTLDSYTDSRGGAAYNQKLSQSRADAAVAFLISRRIAPPRLASRGGGESNPVNKCLDNVPCTEEEYAANRRTEIRITKVQ